MPANPDPNLTTAHLTAANTLEPAITGWEIFLQDQGRSIHTIKAFTADVRLLSTYLPPDYAVGNISTNDLNQFLEWMQKGRGVPCSPKTLARRITSLKAFFRWLHENGVILIDPAEKVVQRSVISPLPEVLTSDEVDLILDTANRHRTAETPDARYYTLVALLLSTGVKKGECLGININHLDLEAPHGPQLFVRYANPKYRYKERKIPLPEDWISALNEYKIQYEIVDQLFPWSPRRLEYLLEDLSDEAGLEKHLSFDMCRWTCALLDWDRGMDPDKIRQKLGISKIQW
ncbi:MAG: tyrosine-type recombinase/integrase, partial [Anaerolineales bacterium]